MLSVCGLGDPTDIDVVRVLFPNEDLALLAGGTMAGLRAMTLGSLLGYKTVEFYGFDSCYFKYDKDGEPIYYSYEKSRKENAPAKLCFFHGSNPPFYDKILLHERALTGSMPLSAYEFYIGISKVSRKCKASNSYLIGFRSILKSYFLWQKNF